MDNKLYLNISLFSESPSFTKDDIATILENVYGCYTQKTESYKDLLGFGPQVILITDVSNTQEGISLFFNIRNHFKKYVAVILITEDEKESLKETESFIYMPLADAGIQDCISLSEIKSEDNYSGISKAIVRAYYRANYINSKIK